MLKKIAKWLYPDIFREVEELRFANTKLVLEKLNEEKHIRG